MTSLVTHAGSIGRLIGGLPAAQGEAVVLADIRTTDAPVPVGLCDMSDAVALNALVAHRAVSPIVHTAATLSTGIRADPVRGVRVNFMGKANVLDCAPCLFLGRIVCASSTTLGYIGFGQHDATPIEEDLPLRLLSNRPASVYAMAKIAGACFGGGGRRRSARKEVDFPSDAEVVGGQLFAD